MVINPYASSAMEHQPIKTNVLSIPAQDISWGRACEISTVKIVVERHQSEIVLLGRCIVEGIIEIKLKRCLGFLGEGKCREVLGGTRIIHR